MFLKLKNQIFRLKSDFLILYKFVFFAPSFYQIFETGLCLLNNINNMATTLLLSAYTLAEQKVSKQQLIKVSLPWLYTMYMMFYSIR